MKKSLLLLIFALLFIVSISSADTFGTDENQFEIQFVTIMSDTNPTTGIPAGNLFTFTGVNYDYRIGKFEITNDQWNKFRNELGIPVTGNPLSAYDKNPTWTGTIVPTNELSWYEAAQFINWLNISKGYQPAYKFTGTQGTSEYSFTVWDVTDIGYNASNPYRNSNSIYFLPTEDEWIKAAYWNDTSLQTYATIDDSAPLAGVDTNYNNTIGQPWDVGSGSAELNGTYDMMGNVWEWIESPWYTGEYLPDAYRSNRGGTYYIAGGSVTDLQVSRRNGGEPHLELFETGFRVASVSVSDPLTLSIDIKPQSCPNPLNIKSKGVLPVAILGSEEFDVLGIDPNTISLEGIAPIRSSYEDVSTPIVDEVDCACTTEGPDGYMDLTLKFDRQEILAALGEIEDGQEWLLHLTGTLYDGTEIEGSDCIIIRKKGNKE